MTNSSALQYRGFWGLGSGLAGLDEASLRSMVEKSIGVLMMEG